MSSNRRGSAERMFPCRDCGARPHAPCVTYRPRHGNAPGARASWAHHDRHQRLQDTLRASQHVGYLERQLDSWYEARRAVRRLIGEVRPVADHDGSLRASVILARLEEIVP